MPARYECDQCGACCQHLIVEIDYLDVLREPRLREASEPFRVPEGMDLEDADGNVVEDPEPHMAGALLACGSTRPCPLLSTDHRCTIYPTRPNCCVGLQAGDDQCQLARQMAGLPPLEPKEGAHA